jgi:hypothetical protein
MILLLRIISDEDQDFFRDMVIDGSDTFLDLHQVLQEDLGYDPSQLASFFITNEKWEKQQEITPIDMMEEPGVETLTMGEVTVGEYLTQVNQRMIYVFDFFSERAFFMELVEISDQTSPRGTPFIGKSGGEPPPQLALDLLGDDDDTGREGEYFMNDLDDLRMDDLRMDDLRMDDLDDLDDLDELDDLGQDLLDPENPDDF